MTKINISNNTTFNSWNQNKVLGKVDMDVTVSLKVYTLKP